MPRSVNFTLVLNDNHIKSALEGYTYHQLYSSNLDTQVHMLHVFQRILKLRSKILKSQTEQEESSSQASPDNSGASYTMLV